MPKSSVSAYKCPVPNCDALASVAYTYTLGRRSLGVEAMIEMARVFCARGHHSDVELETIDFD